MTTETTITRQDMTNRLTELHAANGGPRHTALTQTRLDAWTAIRDQHDETVGILLDAAQRAGIIMYADTTNETVRRLANDRAAAAVAEAAESATRLDNSEPARQQDDSYRIELSDWVYRDLRSAYLSKQDVEEWVESTRRALESA